QLVFFIFTSFVGSSLGGNVYATLSYQSSDDYNPQLVTFVLDRSLNKDRSAILGIDQAGNLVYNLSTIEYDYGDLVLGKEDLWEAHPVEGGEKFLLLTNMLYEIWGNGTLYKNYSRILLDQGYDVQTGWSADRLPNDHTITIAMNYTNAEKTEVDLSSLFVIELNESDHVVWTWNPWDWYSPPDVINETSGLPISKPDWSLLDWTHLNDIDRIYYQPPYINASTDPEFGYTLISFRNFGVSNRQRDYNGTDHAVNWTDTHDPVFIINSTGHTVWSFGKGILDHQHNPDFLPDNKIIVSDSKNNVVLEVDCFSKQIIWECAFTPNASSSDFQWPRDADITPYGTILICDTHNHRIVEVTHDKEVVWEYVLPIDSVPGSVDRDWVFVFPPTVEPVGNYTDTIFVSHISTVVLTTAIAPGFTILTSLLVIPIILLYRRKNTFPKF
ncbi:MAG: aryl-sulfate sulfotransferase, partial [Candidatus Hodarchaeota archaeon]